MKFFKTFLFTTAFFSILLFAEKPRYYYEMKGAGFSYGYDSRLKNSVWTLEVLSKESITGDVSRNLFRFKQNPYIPDPVQAKLADFKGSGFDRGHLAPAGDFVSDENAMEESFFLTNASPQNRSFNRGYWRTFEEYTRDLTEIYDTVTVITGPLFLPYDAPDGKRYVTYEVIGENYIAVPTHFFKVITAKIGDTAIKWAYILPNKNIDRNIPLKDFEVTLEKVQKVSGILF